MALHLPRFSYDDLARLPDDGRRYELADGDLLVSPAPTTDHQGISARLGALLFRAEEASFGRMFTAPTNVYFGPYRVVQPDLLFVARDQLDIITRMHIAGAPDLIVEILSPGTRDRDLGWKKTLYVREGVRHYRVVDPLDQTVRSFVLGERGYADVAPLSGDAPLSCALFPGIGSVVERLFPAAVGH
jgi:Uma2 family endonuclease